MFQLFFRFPEFSEFLFHLGKTLIKLQLIQLKLLEENFRNVFQLQRIVDILTKVFPSLFSNIFLFSFCRIIQLIDGILFGFKFTMMTNYRIN